MYTLANYLHTNTMWHKIYQLKWQQYTGDDNGALKKITGWNENGK